jgi:hypothetical protein
LAVLPAACYEQIAVREKRSEDELKKKGARKHSFSICFSCFVFLIAILHSEAISKRCFAFFLCALL